ncbi:MAG: beta-galactosidase [Lachnospiraceae bacterium]|nr:beta-galactosidase [Lachnospiraceae bacterium]
MIYHEKLIYGVAYYAEYMPYDRIPTDMEMMKKAGINTIRIAESTWSTWEPSDGSFDFHILHQVLDAAATYDINVIIGTPTYAIPCWLSKKYPDILAETHGGPGLYGHRQNMDITHPGYLFHSERIIRKLMEECASHPKVIGFQLDNETKSYDTAGPRAQQQFVSYLKEKFVTTDAMNKAYGLTYWSNRIDNWDDFPDVRGTINASLGAEYKRFQRYLVTKFLSWQASIVKEYALPHHFITQNFDFAWSDHSIGLQPEVNQRDAAKALTVAGVDIYHPSAALLTGAEIAMGGSMGRSIKKDTYLVLETQAQGNPGWLPYPGQLRLQAYSHLSHGASAVMYWHWHSIHHSFETYWKGVLSHDLKENASYREVCRIGNEFIQYNEHLIGFRPDAEVAIVLCNDALTALSYFPIGKDLSFNHVMRWLFDALYEMNITCDFIYPEDICALSEAELLAKYELLILPSLYVTAPEVSTKLDAYVKEGGNLIGTFRSSMADVHGGIYADMLPYGLTKCFGMTYDQFTIPEDVALKSKLPGFSSPDKAYTESSVKVAEFMELLRPLDDTCERLASYTHPAYEGYGGITFHPYGKGNSAYFGCYFDKDVLKVFLKEILRRMKISIPGCHFPVICKKGVNKAGETLIYVFNYSKDSSYVNFNDYLVNTAQNDALYTNLFTGEDIAFNDKVALAPWDVQIFVCK